MGAHLYPSATESCVWYQPKSWLVRTVPGPATSWNSPRPHVGPGPSVALCPIDGRLSWLHFLKSWVAHAGGRSVNRITTIPAVWWRAHGYRYGAISGPETLQHSFRHVCKEAKRVTSLFLSPFFLFLFNISPGFAFTEDNGRCVLLACYNLTPEPHFLLLWSCPCYLRPRLCFPVSEERRARSSLLNAPLSFISLCSVISLSPERDAAQHRPPLRRASSFPVEREMISETRCTFVV